MAKEQVKEDITMENKGFGEVKIASDVVAVIAALAAAEVDGVYSMAGNLTNELVGKFGMKNMSKGVKAQMGDGEVCVDIMINVKYGYSIRDISEQVQTKVSQQIEMMTGLNVVAVNVRVAGVNLEQ